MVFKWATKLQKQNSQSPGTPEVKGILRSFSLTSSFIDGIPTKSQEREIESDLPEVIPRTNVRARARPQSLMSIQD